MQNKIIAIDIILCILQFLF